MHVRLPLWFARFALAFARGLPYVIFACAFRCCHMSLTASRRVCLLSCIASILSSSRILQQSHASPLMLSPPLCLFMCPIVAVHFLLLSCIHVHAVFSHCNQYRVCCFVPAAEEEDRRPMMTRMDSPGNPAKARNLFHLDLISASISASSRPQHAPPIRRLTGVISVVDDHILYAHLKATSGSNSPLRETLQSS